MQRPTARRRRPGNREEAEVAQEIGANIKGSERIRMTRDFVGMQTGVGSTQEALGRIYDRRETAAYGKGRNI